MPKLNCIQIQVADPCHQSWDDMTAAGQGRFCNACQKTVIDFTAYSDAALYRFFAANPQNVCGRFLNTQLNVPINIPHQPHSRLYRMTVALGLTLLFTQTPALLAQNRPPIAAQEAGNSKAADSAIARPSGVISGTVIDEKEEPMISAVVHVYQRGILKGGALTDYDGNYTIKPLEAGRYELLLTFPGYDSVRAGNLLVTQYETIVKKFTMIRSSRKAGNGEEDMVMGIYVGGNWNSHFFEGKTAGPRGEIYGRVIDKYGKPMADATIALYKNGTLKNKRLTNRNGDYDITKFEPGAYELRLCDAGDSVVFKDEIWISEGKQEQNINLSKSK